MGSGGETVRETVTHLVGGGERVGVLQLRLYRPFPADELLAALPASVRQVAVLDRTKEPGLQRRAALPRRRSPPWPRPTSAATGPPSRGSSAAATGCPPRSSRPAMVAGIFAELALADAAPPVHDRHHRRRRRHQPALRRRPRHRGPGDPARGLLRPRLRRHGRREQEHHQDPRRRPGRARAGLLRLRLQEVRRPHRVAPALRAAPDPRALPGEPGRLRRLPPPRAARHGRRAGLRRGRRDPAAQRPAARRTRCGTPCPGRCSSR